jgi:hypothetical protein
MRRTLAVALATVALLAGGCAQHRTAAEPASTHRPPAAPASAARDATSTGASPGADVDGLLDEVDRQLQADDQPAQDQD